MGDPAAVAGGELMGQVRDAFTALLGFLTLADSGDFGGQHRSAFVDEAVEQARRLGRLSQGNLLLVVARNQSELCERLRQVFGGVTGVEIIVDRRQPEREGAPRDERRRLDITEDLQRFGVGIGRPYFVIDRPA
jgi:hypothetical protein